MKIFNLNYKKRYIAKEALFYREHSLSKKENIIFLLANVIPSLLIAGMFFITKSTLAGYKLTDLTLLTVFASIFTGWSVAILLSYVISAFIKKKIPAWLWVFPAVFYTSMFVLNLFLLFNLESTINSLPSRVFSLIDFILISSTAIVIPIFISLAILGNAIIKRFSSTNSLYASIFGTLTLPVLIYLSFLLLITSIEGSNEIWTFLWISVTAFSILSIFLLLIFLAIIISAIMKKLSSKQKVFLESLFCFFTPLISLIAYQLTHSLLQSGESYIMGNYFVPWFLSLLIASSVLFAIPDKAGKFTIPIFFARITILPFILYLLTIYLPFAPFATVTIFVGLGIFLLAPVIFSIVCIKKLYRQFIRMNQGKKLILIATIIFFLIIPASFTSVAVTDRQEIDKVADFIYREDWTAADFQFNRKKVNRILSCANFDEDMHTGSFWGEDGYPLLTPLYSKIVFRNQKFSQTTLSDIENFTGYKSRVQKSEPAMDRFTGKIKKARKETTFNPDKNCYETKIELDVTCENWQREYRGLIKVSGEAFISEYFLIIGDRKEYGILSERKSAEWVYESIVSRRQDPGFLRYDETGNLLLNVFPIEQNQTRTTGFTIYHEEPITLEYEGKKIEIKEGRISPEPTKQTLTPVLYIFLDKKIATSLKNNGEEIRTWIASEIANANPDLSELSAHYYVADTSVHTIDNLEKSEEDLGLDAFRASLFAFSSHDYTGNTYPLPVFITLNEKEKRDSFSSSLKNIIYLSREIAPYINTFPVSDKLVIIQQGEKAQLYTFSEHRIKKSNSKNLKQNLIIEADKITEFSEAAKLAEGKVFTKEKKEYIQTMKSLKSGDIASLISPQFHKENQKALVYESFENKTLTNQTSFLALETEQQKAVLEDYQSKALKTMKGKMYETDSLEEKSEPALFLLIVSALMILGMYINKSLSRGRPGRQ
ncbi:MAG: MSEP-CTERM sorting domain-containing protein [Spirochaetales bacterium]|nr:MSEP-CTERM sorting domain-containing protein [Spirochaetales bacterium]